MNARTILCPLVTAILLTVAGTNAFAQWSMGEIIPATNNTPFDTRTWNPLRNRHPSITTFTDPSNRLATGRVFFRDDYPAGSNIIVLLYPPQGNAAFAMWNVAGQASGPLMFNNNNVIVGSDWRIEIVFGNGVKSQVHRIGDIAGYDGVGTFVVNATHVFLTK